ncbi:hypothetical protein E0H93_32145 [Rhizobium leguminosarum bv. viciae]|uniref:phospholipase D-like domain-containing protein n=1 Tax=Rhizobium leguminosarum TaxID=384 RepID=UPI00103BF7B5|nr:phospholipase D-like domain-containing protein [Rhizobium leguminosarum]TBY21705.1 hypothetical protein E0H55_34175 [Rhizobium leguminosarum bv. viciae]TCA96780.1 hypothetical protein E0H93_32145 [Rhizobium leguminosarum bv. viciae]
MLLDQSIVDEIKSRWESYGGDRLKPRDLTATKTSVKPIDAIDAFWRKRAIAPSADGREFRSITPAAPVPMESTSLPADIRAERVLGTSDLLEVVFLEAALSVARTVARIRVGTAIGSLLGWGTGFLVSPRLLLTNWHVLKTEDVARTSTAEFGYETRLGDLAARNGAIFKLRPDLFFLSDRALDFALVAIEGSGNGGENLSGFGFNALIDDDETLIIKGQFANIIQHPSGQPKQLAFRQNEVIEKPESFLHYRTDTAPGSSGAPVFNDQWQVVALHRAGVWATNDAGQILAMDNTVWNEAMGEERIKWISNEGVRVPSLLRIWRSKVGSVRDNSYLEEVFSPKTSSVTEEMIANPSRHSSSDLNGKPRETVIAPAGGVTSSASDGVATWTIPLKVSIALGDLPAPVVSGAGVGSSSTGVLNAIDSATGPEPKATPAPDMETTLRRAREILGKGRDDILRIRAGWEFDENGVTDRRALVVVVKRKRSLADLARAGVTELPSNFEGYPVEVMGPSVQDMLRLAVGPSRAESLMPASVSPEEITYKPPVGLSLEEVRDTMHVVAHVSPDAGWPTLKAFIGDARETLVGAMYEFTAPYIRDVLVAAAKKNGFKKLTLVLDSNRGSVKNDPNVPDSEAMIRAMEPVLRKKLDTAWVKLGSVNGWVNHDYHIKVLVRDAEAFWLSSGNWKESGQPEADPAGDDELLKRLLLKNNREWHAVIEHRGLATAYQTAILGDYEANLNTRPQEPELPGLFFVGPTAPLRSEAAPVYRHFVPFDECREFVVRPLLTPDNYVDTVIDLVKSGQNSVLIQNQSLAMPPAQADGRYRVLWETILKKQRNCDVRLIFRVQDRDPTGGREMFEALKDYGFDPKRIKKQTGCHTKGMIVDGRHVLLGSHNLTNMGATTNRDASLLFDDVQLATYFGEIFEHDWENLAQTVTAQAWRGSELMLGDGSQPEGAELFDWKAWFEAQ